MQKGVGHFVISTRSDNISLSPEMFRWLDMGVMTTVENAFDVVWSPACQDAKRGQIWVWWGVWSNARLIKGARSIRAWVTKPGTFKWEV